MDLELGGKVAIVTGGASRGLGENMAVRLLEEGCRVMVADRDADRNAELVARLAPLGEVAGHVADVSTDDFAEPLAEATLAAFGGIDVVVNNAATYPSRPWNEYTVAEWDRTIDTNLRSLFLISKATVPRIAARGGGSIVNIGSITFAIGMANILPYVSSKGGLVGFTRALAREVGAQNIRVNNISPGAFPTGGETIHPDPQAYSRFVIEQQSLKRRGTADELADAVAYFASERASFITGQTLHVCGGWTFH
jgi:NAD(P)-dependent dehydrogenase (short-subunit alcohol dehydrogenase family)